MKTKNSFVPILAIMFAILLSSCDNDNDNGNNNDWVIDIYPIWFEMKVNDANGSTRLNPVADADFLQNTYITYSGQTFKATIYTEDSKSRFYLPIFYGLVLTTDNNGTPYLFFGEFDGAKNTEDESFTIHWGDGSTDVVSYDNKVTISGKEIDRDIHYYVNGEETDTHQLTFIK